MMTHIGFQRFNSVAELRDSNLTQPSKFHCLCTACGYPLSLPMSKEDIQVDKAFGGLGFDSYCDSCGQRHIQSY